MVFILTTLLLTTIVSGADFCWKNSYERGVGVIPQVCPDDTEKIDLNCYIPCPAKTFRSGSDCLSICPSVFSDEGTSCKMSNYSRNGYKWKHSDGFSTKNVIKRCETDHGAGNCEKFGALVYPKCKEGYNSIGCCTCSVSPVNCSSHGLDTINEFTCQKKIYKSNRIAPSCKPGQEEDSGLCFEKCREGFYGVGPTCWGKTPRNMVDCGIAAAKDLTTCDYVIINNFSSIGKLARTIADLSLESGTTPDLENRKTKINEILERIRGISQKNENNKKNKKTKELQKLINEIDSLFLKDRLSKDKASWRELIKKTKKLTDLFEEDSEADDSPDKYPKCSN